MADLVTAGGWRDRSDEVTNHQVECEHILSPRRVKEKSMKRSSADLAKATDRGNTETQVVCLNHFTALLHSFVVTHTCGHCGDGVNIDHNIITLETCVITLSKCSTLAQCALSSAWQTNHPCEYSMIKIFVFLLKQPNTNIVLSHVMIC